MRLNRAKCLDLAQRVFKATRANETQVAISAWSSALTRFANNEIHQNVAEDGVQLTVSLILGKRTAKATTGRLDQSGINEVVERAQNLAQMAPEQDLPRMPERQRYSPLRRADSRTARLTPGQRAKLVKEAVKKVKAGGLNSAGYLSNQNSVTAMANSRGLFAFDRHTEAEFSLTVLTPDSSGWAKGSAPGVDDLHIEELTDQAVQKAVVGQGPKDLDPGTYTVILEPAAVADLLGFMIGDFGGLTVHLKQSFLTDRVGTRLFGEKISIADDVAHPLQMGLPFDGDGLPRKRVVLVNRGVIHDLVYSLTTAHKLGEQPTGHGLFFEAGECPQNVIMEGGTSSLEEMIASTQRGLLITRFWYIREVDPAQKILTGMTRDGTFYIEDGQVRHGVKNLRFNQGLVQLLNQVEMLGRPVRAAGEEHYGSMVMPPLKISAFNFTGKTVF